jgi:hypothetical protein
MFLVSHSHISLRIICRSLQRAGVLLLLQIPHILRALLRIRNHLDEEICKCRAAELRILTPVQIPIVYALLVRRVPQPGPLVWGPAHRCVLPACYRELRLCLCLRSDRSCRRSLRRACGRRERAGACGEVEWENVGHAGALAPRGSDGGVCGSLVRAPDLTFLS